MQYGKNLLGFCTAQQKGLCSLVLYDVQDKGQSTHPALKNENTSLLLKVLHKDSAHSSARYFMSVRWILDERIIKDEM